MAKLIYANKPIDLNGLAKIVHEGNVKRGFYDDMKLKEEDGFGGMKVKEKNVGEILMLIVSEAAEALEADRKGRYTNPGDENNPMLTIGDVLQVSETHPNDWRDTFERNIKDTFEDELADIVIRVLDYCGYKKIDILGHILAKHRYNQGREYKHGGKKY